MQKLIFVEGNNTANLNSELRCGFTVKSITPVFEPVAITGKGTSSCAENVRGKFGAYVVIDNE